MMSYYCLIFFSFIQKQKQCKFDVYSMSNFATHVLRHLKVFIVKVGSLAGLQQFFSVFKQGRILSPSYDFSLIFIQLFCLQESHSFLAAVMHCLDFSLMTACAGPCQLEMR